MQRYSHLVSGGLLDGRRYYVGNTGKSFASPMKELNEETVLIEKTIIMTATVNIRNMMIRWISIIAVMI